MESFPNQARNEIYLLAGRAGQHDRSVALPSAPPRGRHSRLRAAKFPGCRGNSLTQIKVAVASPA
jgi:hypothetical protein